MGLLKITSETGMFHSACEQTIDGVASWYGFQPSTSRRPIAMGRVDTSNRAAHINHFVTFEISDTTLRTGIASAVRKYTGKTYALGAVDCVSFSADVARNCGLTLPLVNMTPYGLVQILAFYNTYVAKG